MAASTPRSTGILAADAKLTPWWWEAAPRPDHSRVPIPRRVDVAIVGSGYAGLSAALTLARAGREVAVFEAGDPGFGASSRSGGMIGSGHRMGTKGFSGLAAELGEARAIALLKEGVGALEFTTALIEREGIDCAFRRVGRFRAACRARDYDTIGRDIDLLRRKVGIAVDMVPASGSAQEVATEHYHGGCVFHEHGGLHPGLFQLGLLDRARAAGATVCGQAEVRAIDGQRGAFELATARGRAFACEVLVATNGYTGAATPALRRRLIPVASFIIATEPIGEDAVARTIPSRRMIVETRSRHCYYRPSPDGDRLLFGGRAALHPIDLRRSAKRLHGFMTRLFPSLAGVRVTHSWTGNIAFSRDHLTHIGVRDGIHYALACNGSGVAMAPYAGHKAALKLLGSPEGRTAFDAFEFRAYPFYGGRPWFLPLVEGFYRARDAWEERRQ